MRNNRSWILDMLGQGSVAGFAAEIGVLAFAFDLHLIGMARFASLAAGELDGPGADIVERAGAIVPPQLAEVGGDDGVAD